MKGDGHNTVTPAEHDSEAQPGGPEEAGAHQSIPFDGVAEQSPPPTLCMPGDGVAEEQRPPPTRSSARDAKATSCSTLLLPSTLCVGDEYPFNAATGLLTLRKLFSISA